MILRFISLSQKYSTPSNTIKSFNKQLSKCFFGNKTPINTLTNHHKSNTRNKGKVLFQQNKDEKKNIDRQKLHRQQPIKNIQNKKRNVRLSIQHQDDQDMIQKIKELQQMSLEVLIDKRQHFYYNAILLCIYLSKLKIYLNKGSIEKYKLQFIEIHSKLINIGSVLLLRPKEVLQILSYYIKYYNLTKQTNQFTLFHGFIQHSYQMISNSLHQNTITFTQSIYFLQILTGIGQTHLPFFINYTKFLKRQFLSKNSNAITLTHILTIISTKLQKSNQIIIEHIIYDQVLFFLFSHQKRLIDGESILMKWELCCVLLCIDMRFYYRSSCFEKQKLLCKLLNEILNNLEYSWTQNLIQSTQDKIESHQNKKINIRQIVYLLQCINYCKINQIQNQSYEEYFKQIILKIQHRFIQFLSTINEKKNNFGGQDFFRLVFNKDILSCWILDSKQRQNLQQLLWKRDLNGKQNLIKPLLNIINAQHIQQQSMFKQLIEIASNAYTQYSAQKVIVWPLTISLLKHIPDLASKKIIKSLNIVNKQARNIQKKHLIASILLLKYISKVWKIQLKIPEDVMSIVDNNINHFLKNLHEACLEFQCKDIYEIGVLLLEQRIQKLSPLLKNMNNFISEQQANYLQTIVSQNLFYFTSIIFNHSQPSNIPNNLSVYYDKFILFPNVTYNLLLQTYLDKAPTSDHFVNVHASENYKIIKQQISSLSHILTKESKYNYFLWDIFISRYIRLNNKQKQQAFDQLQLIFKKAYRTQIISQAIMLNTISALIASKSIRSPKLKLQNFFESCLDILLENMQVGEIEQNRYRCVNLIVFNGLSAGILQDHYFNKIMMHAVKFQEIKYTSSLMLIFGAIRKGQLITIKVYQQQISYLNYLLTHNKVILDDDSVSQQAPNGMFKLGFQLLSILLRFGIPNITLLIQKIIAFIRKGNSYIEWSCIAMNYQKQNYSLSNKEQSFFRHSMSKCMIQKMIYFKGLGLIDSEEEAIILNKFK